MSEIATKRTFDAPQLPMQRKAFAATCERLAARQPQVFKWCQAWAIPMLLRDGEWVHAKTWEEVHQFEKLLKEERNNG